PALPRQSLLLLRLLPRPRRSGGGHPPLRAPGGGRLLPHHAQRGGAPRGEVPRTGGAVPPPPPPPPPPLRPPRGVRHRPLHLPRRLRKPRPAHPLVPRAPAGVSRSPRVGAGIDPSRPHPRGGPLRARAARGAPLSSGAAASRGWG